MKIESISTEESKIVNIINCKDQSYYCALDIDATTYKVYSFINGLSNLIYESNNMIKIIKRELENELLLIETKWNEVTDENTLDFYLFSNDKLEHCYQTKIKPEENVCKIISFSNYILMVIKDDSTKENKVSLYDFENGSEFSTKGFSEFLSLFNPDVSLFGGKSQMIMLESHLMPYEFEETRERLGMKNSICINQLLMISLEDLVIGIKRDVDKLPWEVIYKSSKEEYISHYKIVGDYVLFDVVEGNKTRIEIYDELDNKKSLVQLSGKTKGLFCDEQDIIAVVENDNIEINRFSYNKNESSIKVKTLNNSINELKFDYIDFIDCIENKILFVIESNNEEKIIKLLDINDNILLESVENILLFSYDNSLYFV